MTNRLHVSEIFQVNNPNHSMFDFVDINIKNDQRIFIDPVLIALNRDKWCKNAKLIIQDFFNKFYQAYRDNNYDMKFYLLSHASEVNHTKLGYGDGKNGHGNKAEGLIKDFLPLEKLIKNIHTIDNVIDVPVLIRGFSEDGLSDLITNIIHDELNNYTIKELKKYNISPNTVHSFHTWDVETSSWINVTKPYFAYDNVKILLTPKRIVRKNYLFSADHYMRMSIIERDQEKYRVTDENGKETNGVSKKQLIDQIIKKDEFWRYEFIHKRTSKNASFLEFYHNRIISLYANKSMSDEDLDNSIYLAGK